MSSLSRSATDIGGNASSIGPSSVSIAAILECWQPGQHDDLVARAQDRRRRPGPHRRGSRAAVARARADHPLHREPHSRSGCGRRRCGRARGDTAAADPDTRASPRSARRRCRRSSAEIGMNVTSGTSSCAANASNSSTILANTSSSKSTRSILLTHTTRCGMPQQRGDERVAAGLREHALGARRSARSPDRPSRRR